MLACALHASAFAADAIRVVSQVSLPNDPPPASATHELSLHAYAFDGTRWRPRLIEEGLRGIADLLAACGVALARVDFVVLDAPQAFHFYSTPVSRELLRRVDVPKPAVFFVEDTRNQPAYDAEAIGLGNSASRPELANTVWVAYGARDLSYTLAHELVHVLSDSGEHSDAPGNLMQPETSPANTRLSPSQCRRLRDRGEANGLLKRRAPR